MGLLEKSNKYIEQQKKTNEIELVIKQLLETKKTLSFHILGARDGDIFVEAISRISDSIEKLEEIKET